MGDNKEFIKIRDNIIKDTVKKIKQYFVITDTDGEVVKENFILNTILKKQVRCVGIIQSSTGKISQCSKNSIEESSYCKIHSNKTISISKLHNGDKISRQGISTVYEEPINIKKLKKEFIEDSFYYIDIVNNFIYTNQGIKAGIVEDNGNYFITNNPYLLNQI